MSCSTELEREFWQIRFPWKADIGQSADFLGHRVGSFYAFILNRAPSVRLTLVARSNYEAVKANVSL
jgi:hypothetical protein